MSILRKIFLLGGRDDNGNARPIKTDAEGRIKVSGIVDGGKSLTVKDVDTGKHVDITALQDDRGEYVLRVVDAAPYIVEISRFDETISYDHLLSEQFSEVLPFNTNRKYASFVNVSSEVVLLSLDDGKPSIAIQPNSSYEMSAMQGNLYKGKIKAAKLSSSGNIFNKELIKQGGIFSDGFSESLTRTYAQPISVTPGKTYGIYVDDPDVRIRNIYGYVDPTTTYGLNILKDGVYESHVFKVPEGITYVGISFCKVNTSANLTPEETKSANITLNEQNIPFYVMEGV